MNSTYILRFISFSLIVGALFVTIGFAILPVHVVLNFDMEMLTKIGSNLEFWVRGFQILVFGYFIRIIGLVAFASLFKEADSKPIINAGVLVCSLAMLVSGLAEGYYMHSGGWAQWKMGLIPAEQHQAMIASLEITNEWASCIKRFGRMFMHLGLCVFGWGMLRSQFMDRWVGILTTVIGVSGICLLMIFEQNPDHYLPMGHIVTAWFILVGGLVYSKSKTNSSPV